MISGREFKEICGNVKFYMINGDNDCNYSWRNSVMCKNGLNVWPHGFEIVTDIIEYFHKKHDIITRHEGFSLLSSHCICHHINSDKP